MTFENNKASTLIKQKYDKMKVALSPQPNQNNLIKAAEKKLEG